jgi:hypothetical protein
LGLPLVLENPDITITNPVPLYTGDNPRVRYLYDLMAHQKILLAKVNNQLAAEEVQHDILEKFSKTHSIVFVKTKSV